MLSETGAACVVIVLFNCAFKNYNKRTTLYIYIYIYIYTHKKCMADFKLSEPNEDFFCIWTIYLAVSYSRLLPQHSLKGKSI